LAGAIVENDGDAGLADLEIVGGDDDLHGRDRIADDELCRGVGLARATAPQQQKEPEPEEGIGFGHSGREKREERRE
jgi:hypothetical protein